MPGKSWSIVLSLCGSLEPWFDGTWRPGEIELTTPVVETIGAEAASRFTGRIVSVMVEVE